MWQPHKIILAASVVVASCAPSANTNDENANELIDMVVLREAPFSECVEIGPQTVIVEYPDDYAAPIMGLSPGAFSDAEINSVASELAVDIDQVNWGKLNDEGSNVIGEPDTIDGTGKCTMYVENPVFADDYAFVDFSAPSGAIGAYAFKQTSGRWRVAERLQFGWW